MRNTFVAVLIVFALVAGQLDAATLPADVGFGRMAWFDITTSSLPQSKEFYGRLFNWRFTPLEGTDQAVEIHAGRKSIGTLRATEGAISASNGVVYIQVADILASCERAKMLGGSVVNGFPFNLPEGIGAIAVVLDPAGHPVGMYSRKAVSLKSAPPN